MSELSKGEQTKQKLIATTAKLLQRQGYHATGLAQIVEESGAPRGSLYFHFPGGKDELAKLALEQSGSQWRSRIEAIVEHAPELGVAIEEVCKYLAEDLEASKYEHGCPVAAVALESAATSKTVRAAVADHFAGWQDAIVGRLAAIGMTPAAARDTATFMLASVEGALLLAKVTRTKEPLLVVGRSLRAMAAMLAPKKK